MKRLRRQRGATLVELALVVLVFFTLILGIVEFGRAYNIYQNITNAAREGARYSVAPFEDSNNLPSPDQVTAQVQKYLDSSNVKGATVQVNQTVAGTMSGLPVVSTEVDVTAPYEFLFFPFGTINMKTKSVMLNETN